jgi:hypothetical protein
VCGSSHAECCTGSGRDMAVRGREDHAHASMRPTSPCARMRLARTAHMGLRGTHSPVLKSARPGARHKAPSRSRKEAWRRRESERFVRGD